ELQARTTNAREAIPHVWRRPIGLSLPTIGCCVESPLMSPSVAAIKRGLPGARIRRSQIKELCFQDVSVTSGVLIAGQKGRDAADGEMDGYPLRSRREFPNYLLATRVF